ncbi:GNAT family N-acetyltransferase [Albimonas sp. CAU 1670]|uniref:GNAT family N-acetyltransferase n=1 Tax=Albimonas sp. CAU 1670 TaxID=3032599 RepID=UPI0023DBD759|nr:GNAT family N-acetyltransferase [Albimonas sp. CAU 1670]MDF2234783.1 GNAT family N-acetyltransferase [Albimonas sp. CAU 1670]
MSDPDLRFAPARPEDAPEALEACAPIFESAPSLGDWWARRLRDPRGRVLLTRDASRPSQAGSGGPGRLVALTIVDERPMVALDGRAALTLPLADAPPGLDAALLPEVDALARRLGVGLLTATIPAPDDGDPPCPAGYAPLQRLLVVSLPLDQPASAPPEGVAVAPHDGGDPAAEAEAADLSWRMMRREGVWPRLDGPAVAALMAAPDSLWLLARDAASGRVVGVAETSPQMGFYSMMAIARSHWGTGLADHMTREGLRAMAARGATHAFSLVRPGNAASLKLQARAGAAPTGAMMMFARKVPQPAMA